MSASAISALAATLTLAVAWPSPRAVACKVEMLPAESSLYARTTVRPTLGASPVFATVGDPPRIEDEATHEVVAMVRIDDLDGLHSQSTALALWRPAAPLADAHGYRVSGIALDMVTGFDVDARLSDLAPPARSARLHLTLDGASATGCGDSSSCDGIDFTRLDILVAPPGDGSDMPEVYLLELTTPDDGDRLRVVVSASFAPEADGSRRISTWNDPEDIGRFERETVCAVVTPVESDGALGARIDLGCVSGRHPDGRVEDRRDCSAAPFDMAWWLAALALMARRASLTAGRSSDCSPARPRLWRARTRSSRC